ncbi:hypothetical protein IWX58_003514 [Rubrivivax gelatinosus]|nr:hypothetical protein [Rubrivivax gelatinosus]MBG6081827.1 hypothetical protein [Rubrivivax gelatinosus]
MIALDDIKSSDELVGDEIFGSKYRAFLLGKAPIHETRVSLTRIRRGFWTRSAGQWKLVEDPISERDIADIAALVRLGSRPVLHLYENQNPADDKRFVCADDVVVHAVYEKLGIQKVPVALMGKPRDMEESCLSVRCFHRKSRAPIPLLESVAPVVHSLVPSTLGATKPPTAVALEKLLLALEQTKCSLRDFHQPGSTKLHYHHTLYSVLLRAAECIDSMRMLIEAGKPMSAAALLRSLFELVLVFYVDWLAPGQTYRYLQMASVQSEKEWEARCELWRRAEIAEGTSPVDAKNIKDAHMRAFRLGAVVGERARLFPLGEKFQSDVYSFLSDIIHHDFSMTARYAHTLDHGDELVYHGDVERTILHLADILVAAVISRIRDDIGVQAEALRSDGSQETPPK